MESPHWKLEIRNCFAHISVIEREPMLWRLRLPILHGTASHHDCPRVESPPYHGLLLYSRPDLLLRHLLLDYRNDGYLRWIVSSARSWSWRSVRGHLRALLRALRSWPVCRRPKTWEPRRFLRRSSVGYGRVAASALVFGLSLDVVRLCPGPIFRHPSSCGLDGRLRSFFHCHGCEQCHRLRRNTPQ